MKKRIAAGFLLLCLLALSVQAFALAEALEQDPCEAWLWEPYTEEDDSLSTGRVTYWSCVTFGSYPQTEIVASSFTAVDDYAVQEGDVLEDPGLYEKLAGAEWQDNRGILVTCRDAAVIPVLVLDLDSAVYEYAGVYTAGER